MENLQAQKPKRNSAIELMRFFFALVVLIGHPFLPPHTWASQPGLPVEGFFMLSGWFLIGQMQKAADKYGQYGPWRSNWKFFKQKFSSIIIPVLFPAYFALMVAMFIDNKTAGMSILWYIHDLVILVPVYYLVYYQMVYKKGNFNNYLKFLIIICCTAIVLRFALIPLFPNPFGTFVPFIRAISSISLGMLCSLIPKINKRKSLIITMFVLFFILTTLNNIAPSSINDNINAALNFIVIPTALYFGFQINFYFAPFNYLGKLSAPLYFYQSLTYVLLGVGDWLNHPILTNGYFLIGMTFAFAIFHDSMLRIYKHQKNKKPKPPELPLPLTEKVTIKFEKRPGYEWFIHSLTILVSLAFIALAILGLSFKLLQVPGWENWWWMDDKGNFTWYAKSMIFGLGVFFTPLFLSINLSLLLKGRKKYPIKNKKG